LFGFIEGEVKEIKEIKGRIWGIRTYGSVRGIKPNGIQKNVWKGEIGYGPLDIMDKDVDIFSQDGYFLYRTNLPPNTSVIKDGFLYTREVNEDEGMEYVKRYKIKNWDLIKERIK